MLVPKEFDPRTAEDKTYIQKMGVRSTVEAGLMFALKTVDELGCKTPDIEFDYREMMDTTTGEPVGWYFVTVKAVYEGELVPKAQTPKPDQGAPSSE